MLNSSPNYQGKQEKGNYQRRQALEEDQNPVDFLTAENSSRANFSKLNCVESCSVAAPNKVLLNSKVDKETMQEESRARLRVISVI